MLDKSDRTILATVQEAAAELRMSAARVYQLTDRQELAWKRFGERGKRVVVHWGPERGADSPPSLEEFIANAPSY